MLVRYVVHCYNCSHGEMPCDELQEDQRCPHCHSVPSSYTHNGKDYCWLHRELLSETYSIAANFLFKEYSWRGCQVEFPNAKLYEAALGEQVDGMSCFCGKCQQVFDRWLANWELDDKVAEQWRST